MYAVIDRNATKYYYTIVVIIGWSVMINEWRNEIRSSGNRRIPLKDAAHAFRHLPVQMQFVYCNV